MSESILIIAFKFPPLGGMRVKRMTMFAKYLARRGYRVHVITVNWKVPAPNTWMEETQHPNIIVHRIPSLAPHNLIESRPRGGIRKRVRQAARLLQRLLYFVDYAQYWGVALLPYAARLIHKEHITNVICTGSPFMANYWAARLKVRLPQIHLIQDFRDPWNDHLCAPYSHYFLFDWQKRVSQRCERYALSHADVVVAVTESLTERFRRKTTSNARFVTIPNGFDPDRYQRIRFEPATDKMRMVYIGNLYVGREVVLRVFLEAVSELVANHPGFARRFEIVTYGGFPPQIRREMEHLVQKGVLQINGYVSPAQAREAAGNAFALLLINAEIFPYAVSGKIYEYMALRRPIYAITPDGELTQLMRRGNLGIVAPSSSKEKQKQGLLYLFDLWKQNPAYTPDVSRAFLQEFQYDHLVDQLTVYFEQGR